MAILADIERDAVQLPEDQRLALAEKLISSVEGPGDADAAVAWEKEIARRVEDLRTGAVQGIPASEVFERLERIAPER